MQSKSEEKRKKSMNGAKMGELKKGSGKALKDYHCYCPPHCDVKIKKGQDLSKLELPENIWTSLKSEKVI